MPPTLSTAKRSASSTECNTEGVPRLSPSDERLAHQIPEPLRHVVTRHEHWRESYFFVMHPPEGNEGDVVILTMATYPATERLDSYQMGRIGGAHFFALHQREFGDDPHATVIGPVTIDISEPFRTVRLQVLGEGAAPELDLVFRARTAPYAMRRGTMKRQDEIIWDQSQMIQAGTFDGWYSLHGERREVRDWWGQRDHSWGIRDHPRCPMWMWLALQLPDGMLGLWHWELANGAPVFTDGCYAPSDGSEPIPVVGFCHALDWLDADGAPCSYGLDGADVRGLSGAVEITLAGREPFVVEAAGKWAAPYGPRGGGQHFCTVQLSDGRSGNGVIEITGAHHHRYFPIARAESLPT
jgi:hypothetical protein